MHPQSLTAWVATDTIWSVGSADDVPEYSFHRVRSALYTAAGTIIIADGGSRELRLYDATGRHLGSAGRLGGGPGEFSMVTSVSRFRADSILAYDALGRRLSIWDAELNYIRSIPLEMQSVALDIRYVHPGYLVAVVRSPAEFPSTTGQSVEDSLYAILLSLEADSLRLLGTYAGRSYVSVTPPTGVGRMMLAPLPFAPEPELVVGTAGYYYSGKADWTFSYHEIRSTGQATVTLPLSSRQLDPASVRHWIRTSAQRVQPNVRPAYLRMVQDLPFREVLPAIDQMIEDDVGQLWVRAYVTDRDQLADWYVVSPEGRLTATLRLSPDLRLHQVGADFLLATGRDEFDRELILLLRLEGQR